MSTTLRAEFYFDDESGNWHFRVPALHINGGGSTSRADTERACIDAITFALEGDPGDMTARPKRSRSRCRSLP